MRTFRQYVTLWDHGRYLGVPHDDYNDARLGIRQVTVRRVFAH